MKITDLTVYKSPLPKIRLWKDGDGWYIICDGLQYDCFLSWGIKDDISFEEDFLAKYPHLQCHAFDGSIHQLPPLQKNTSEWKIIFYKKYIGWQEMQDMSHLHTFFEQHTDIMVKMDIEWGEFLWIDSLNDSQLEKIQQIVIEFHNPCIPERWRTLSRLSKTHWLVHFHPNNCSIRKKHFVQYVYVPDIFECTYIRKKSIENNKLPYSQEPIPGPLDQKNTYRKEIIISNFPYNQKWSICIFYKYFFSILETESQNKINKIRYWLRLLFNNILWHK